MNFHRIQTIAQSIAFPFMVICIILLGSSLLRYGDKSSQLDLENVQRTVTKYTIQCYASEGSYPPDLDYLEEHYGLILDREKYIYYYEVFGSNVLPVIDIKVNNGYDGTQ